MGCGSAAGHHGVMRSTAVNRRALLGLVALGGSCAGSGVCALERADGRVRWTVELDAPAQGLVVGGVSRGLVWTNAGALDLRTGEVQAVPGTVARAVNLLAGEGVVVAVVPDEDDADRGELVCLESRDCLRRWSTGIDDPGPSPVRLNSALVAIGMLDRYELDSGEYEPLVCVLGPRPAPREGVFVVVDTDVGAMVRVVVDDDGAAVAVRAFAPRERRYPNGSGHREEYTSGKELWSAPLEARPGAVVAAESALGSTGPPSGSWTWTARAHCTCRTGSPARPERGAPTEDRHGRPHVNRPPPRGGPDGAIGAPPGLRRGRAAY